MAKKQSRRQLRRRAGIMKGAFAGLGSLLTIITPTHAAPINRAAMENALQGDFSRIGNDMRTVVLREKRREEAAG